MTQKLYLVVVETIIVGVFTDARAALTCLKPRAYFAPVIVYEVDAAVVGTMPGKDSNDA